MKLHKSLYMTVFSFCLLALCAPSISFAAGQDAQGSFITLLAEEIPGGFLEIEGTQGKGVYPELFYEAAATSDVKLIFRFVPWGRAFREVEGSTHLLTFPLTRLPERESKYRWLVPLDKDEIVFLSLDKQVNSLEQARKLKEILVWRGSSMEIFLMAQGFTNLISVGKTSAIIRMLKNGRGDAWFTIRPESDEFLDSDGKTVKVLSGDVINSESVWLVGGKSFSHSEASKRFTKAVQRLVDGGRLKQLKAKYGLLPQ